VDGSCTEPHGDGGFMGVFGGRPKVDLGTVRFDFGTRSGDYLQPSSPVPDPINIDSVPQPSNTIPDKTAADIITTGHGCSTATDPNGCVLYQPGYYPNGIANIGSGGPVKKATALFAPGIYYMGSNGFGTQAGGQMRMCSEGCPASSDPDILNGMLVYNKYDGHHASQFDISGTGAVKLVGTPEEGKWGGILFFQDHTAPGATHNIGGGGVLELEGTLYITNTVDRINNYQTIKYNGHPSSDTYLRGEIITDVLSINGDNARLWMRLSGASLHFVQQVTLIQ